MSYLRGSIEIVSLTLFFCSIIVLGAIAFDLMHP
jgi:hypothetical protein